ARSTQYRGPEHEPLNVLPTGSENTLVADFAHEDGHARVARKRSCHLVHSARNTLPATVACLQHVEVEHRGILDLVPCVVGGMNSDRVVIGIDLAHVSGKLSPAPLLERRILGLGL